jgi:hypothetical protein
MWTDNGEAIREYRYSSHVSRAHSLLQGAALYTALFAAASYLKTSSCGDTSRMSFVSENVFNAVCEDVEAISVAVDALWVVVVCSVSNLQNVMSTPSRSSLLHLYGSLLRTSRSFSSYNFRSYFVRRTKRVWREFQVKNVPKLRWPCTHVHPSPKPTHHQNASHCSMVTN